MNSSSLTIDGCLSREDDHHQLKSLVGVLEVSEHGLHAVGSLGVLAEARLTLDGHPCIARDLPQLIRESSEESKQEMFQYLKASGLCRIQIYSNK